MPGLLEPYQINLDMRVLPSVETYDSGTGLTTFTTPCPFHGNVAVRMLTGTIRSLTKVDNFTFTCSGNMTGGAVLGTIAEMDVELSEVVPREADGNPVIREGVTLGLVTLYHGYLDGFTLEVENISAGRGTEEYEYVPSLTTTPPKVREKSVFGVMSRAEESALSVVSETYRSVNIIGVSYALENVETPR